ncbi:MAG: hypothetical protein HKO90_07300 [Flavobacteriaceae bacterium]|nr:hypothetical protein [Flavobacteriaceae bacterium]
MKSLKTYFNLVTLVLSALIFFQGCTVYRSANVSLEEAALADTRVRIKTKDNKTLKFNKVQFENNQFYGKTQYDDKLIKVGIDENNIDRVQVKDKGKSTLLNIGVPVLIIGILALGVVLSISPY